MSRLSLRVNFQLARNRGNRCCELRRYYLSKGRPLKVWGWNATAFVVWILSVLKIQKLGDCIMFLLRVSGMSPI